MTLDHETVQRDVILLARLERIIPEEEIMGATPLDPEDVSQDPIIAGDGIDIADGYHRTAGMILWAQQSGIPTEDIVIDIVRVFDQDAVDAISYHGQEDDDVLEEIYGIAYGDE